jgi:hypothetical protein
MSSFANRWPRNSTIIWMALFTLLCFQTLLGYYWPNLHWPDEIFQSLEQAHRFVFGNGLIPWEYRDGIRNYLFPGFLSIFIWFGQWLGDGTTGYQVLVIIVLVAISLFPVWGMLTYRNWNTREIILLMIALGCWYEIVYYSSKAFTEVFCSNLILGSVFLIYRERTININNIALLILSLIIGLCSGIRIQYLSAVGTVWLWSWFSLPRKAMTWMSAGILAGFLLTGLIDLITWGSPFHSMIMNIKKNLAENVASNWGVQPWFYYFYERFSSLGWYLIPLFFFSLLGIKQFPLLSAILAAVLLPHLMIGHKEFRFIYLAYWCFIALAALGSIQILSAAPCKNQSKLAFSIIITFWIVSSIHLGLTFKGWHISHNMFLAFRTLSKDQEMCGLGTINIPWYRSGGYYYLHRKVPYIEIKDARYFKNGAFPYNRLLIAFNEKIVKSHEDAPVQIDYFFIKNQCWNNICLYKSNKGCINSGPIVYDR